MDKKLFGTDGIRGVANQYPLTIDFCGRLAVILSRKICTVHKKVAIARDTRISGSMLFSALSAGFTSQGIDVLDLGIIPTPLCTTITPQLDVDMSIMITASHNPYQDNGLKFIASSGDKFSDEQSAEVEAALSENISPTFDPNLIGRISSIEVGIAHYISTTSMIAAPNALSGMKIVTDCANGAFSEILPFVFKNLGAEIISLSAEPNGCNINKDCGSQHTENLCRTVVENHYDLGIAVDGDGDRIIICDEKGNRIDGDQIIAYLAKYFKQHNLLKGNAVVATIYSNLGLGKYIRSLGIDFHASAVGERYVIEKMLETNSNVGGEESGHMVLSDYAKTGDALLTALVICLGIKETTLPASKIFPIFKPFPSQSHNLRYDNQDIISQIMENTDVKACIAQISNDLADHGSVIVRKSGTEPVIRLKIEDENAQIAEQAAQKILACIRKIVE